MKKGLALLIAIALVLIAPLALATGNATIAVRGRDGFDDYIDGLLVWGDRLLMPTYNKVYTWSPEEGLSKIEGYEALNITTQEDEDGNRYALIGDEELELDENEYCNLYSSVYPAGDRLFRIAVINGEDGAIATLLVEVVIGEDGSFALGGYVDMDDALLEEYGDGYYGVNMPSSTCFVDGMLYGMMWTSNGRELIAIDVDSGDVDTMPIESDGEIMSITAYDEGRLLMVEALYDEEPQVNLLVYDLEEEESTVLGTLPVLGYNTPSALCYDEARAKMYYVMGGSVWRADVSDDGVGEPEEFGDMPLEIWSDANAVMLGDLYVLSSYYGVLGRDVTVEQLPEKHLTIANYGYVDQFRSAYFDFTAKHPEYMVSIRNGSDGGESELLQNMLSGSTDVDIYTMRVSSERYDALLEHKYMAPLGGSESLSALVGSMYPPLSDLASKDGELYAVPMQMYSRCMVLNKTLLTEKLGYAEDELPNTFEELFELIADISSGKLEEMPELQLLGPGYTSSGAQYSAFSSMFDFYLLWLDADEANLERSGEVLLKLCEAFEKIDWDGFGLPEEYEDDSVWEWNPENIIMEQTTLSIYSQSYDEQMTVVPLALTEGEAVMFPSEVTLAFVNPYSENRDDAIEYLEMAAGLIREENLIAMSPEHNDPIENSYYQENLDWYEKYIADLEESLAEAEEKGDDERVAAFTEGLESAREEMERFREDGRWEVSPESIAAYREFADLQRPAHSSAWSEGVYEMIRQYLDGAIDAQRLVDSLGQTLRMKREEGM